jgi:vacuolar-type H+-ATPase subunit H
MSDFFEQHKQLKIQQGIRKAEDELVDAIQKALDDKSSYDNLEESQFRNLVRVADTSESIAVIKNFLLYQVGRDKKWGKGRNSLAQKIISDIDERISNIAEKIKIDADANVDDFKLIRIELTRRYLGYGARYLVYKNKGEL